MRSWNNCINKKKTAEINHSKIFFFHCAEKQNYLYSNFTIINNQIMWKVSIPTLCLKEVTGIFSIALSSHKNN